MAFVAEDDADRAGIELRHDLRTTGFGVDFILAFGIGLADCHDTVLADCDFDLECVSARSVETFGISNDKRYFWLPFWVRVGFCSQISSVWSVR